MWEFGIVIDVWNTWLSLRFPLFIECKVTVEWLLHIYSTFPLIVTECCWINGFKVDSITVVVFACQSIILIKHKVNSNEKMYSSLGYPYFPNALCISDWPWCSLLAYLNLEIGQNFFLFHVIKCVISLTCLAVIGYSLLLQQSSLVVWDLRFSSKMKAAWSFKTLVTYHFTVCHHNTQHCDLILYLSLVVVSYHHSYNILGIFKCWVNFICVFSHITFIIFSVNLT